MFWLIHCSGRIVPELSLDAALRHARELCTTHGLIRLTRIDGGEEMDARAIIAAWREMGLA